MNSKLKNMLKKFEEQAPIKDDEALIEALNKIIDAEIAKAPKDQDPELINEAIDYVFILEGEDPEKIEKDSECAKNDFLDKLKQKNAFAMSKRKPAHSPIKAMLIAATIVIISTVCIVATLRTLDIKHMDWKTFLSIEKDTELQEGNQSLIISDNFGQYLSISDFLEKEELDSILLPDKKTDNVSVFNYNNYKTVAISYTDGTAYKISTNTPISFDIEATTEINGFDVLITVRDEKIQGNFIYNDKYYSIFVTSIKELTEILNIVKEYYK